ncbi:MAG: hypothetical protein ACRCUS_08775, partial [Anaerovoracaceae bacterium]
SVGKAKITAKVGKKKAIVTVYIKAKTTGGGIEDETGGVSTDDGTVDFGEPTEIERLQAKLGGKNKAKILGKTLTLLEDANIALGESFMIDNGIELIVPEGKNLYGMGIDVGATGIVRLNGKITVFHFQGASGAKLFTAGKSQILMSNNFYSEGEENPEKPKLMSEYTGDNGKWQRVKLSEAERLAYIINNQGGRYINAAEAALSKVILTQSIAALELKLPNAIELELSEDTILTIGNRKEVGKLTLPESADITGDGRISLTENAQAVQESGDISEKIKGEDGASYIILRGENKGRYFYNNEGSAWELGSSKDSAKQLAKQLNAITPGSARNIDNIVELQKDIIVDKDVLIAENVELELNGHQITLKATLCNNGGKISGTGGISVSSKYLQTYNMLYNSGEIDIDGNINAKIQGANFENVGKLKVNNLSDIIDVEGNESNKAVGNFFWKKVSAEGNGFWQKSE